MSEQGERNRRPVRHTRKSHKKSRNGCLSCKKRRIKCDEQGPPCAACVIRGLQCNLVPSPAAETELPVHVDTTAVRPAHDGAIPEVAVSRSNSSHTGGNHATPTTPLDSHLRELELMHQYTAHTYKSLSIVGLTDDTWQDFVPRQALTQTFLLHGLMGLSALHLSHITPSQHDEYLQLSQHYQDSAFRAFSECLDDINPQNCHAMMAFSCIAMVYAIATPKALPEGKVLDRTLVLLSFLQGIGTVAGAGWEWILTGPFKIFLDMNSYFQQTDPVQADEVLLARLRRVNDAALQLVDPKGHQAIASAIDLLDKTFRAGDFSVLAWLAMCGPDFIDRLRQEHRVALLVFLHWAITLQRLNRLWWVGDMANSLVEEISPVLVQLGGDWEAAVQDVRERVATP